MIRSRSLDERRRVVIVGAGGRLGGELVRFYQGRHELICFGRDGLDLAEPQKAAEALRVLDFDHLILTAAQTAVDDCEGNHELAYLVNAVTPGAIAEVCAEKGAHMTHFSTDFVFDGAKREPYVEDDAPHPINKYGDSKLAGEQQVLAASAGHLVIRVSWLYGGGKSAFPEWIVARARADDEVTLPSDKIGCPTYAKDVPSLLDPLLFDGSGPVGGVLHLCNSEPCTWQEWGQHCIDVAWGAGLALKTKRVGASSLESIAAFVAKRPANSALDTSRYSAITGRRPRPWREALTEYLLGSQLLEESAAVA